jgi:hypothetical protein
MSLNQIPTRSLGRGNADQYSFNIHMSRFAEAKLELPDFQSTVCETNNGKIVVVQSSKWQPLALADRISSQEVIQTDVGGF